MHHQIFWSGWGVESRLINIALLFVTLGFCFGGLIFSRNLRISIHHLGGEQARRRLAAFNKRAAWSMALQAICGIYAITITAATPIITADITNALSTPCTLINATYLQTCTWTASNKIASLGVSWGKIRIRCPDSHMPPRTPHFGLVLAA